MCFVILFLKAVKMQNSRKPNSRPLLIYQSLPKEIYGKALDNPEHELMQVVQSEMDAFKFKQCKGDIAFRMRTAAFKGPTKSKRRSKKKYLSKKIRKENDLDKLPKTGWDYNSLQGMRDMWTTYMKNCLSFTTAKYKAPEVGDNNYAQFHNTLAKCELTGGNIIVVKSNNPGYVGMEGTIVLETQQTFQIVTPENKLKILLKQASVFTLRVGNIQFTIYGQSLLIRPHERCVKKLKAFIKLDL